MGDDFIKVYGTKWCGDCYRARFILDRQRIPYKWIDINKDDAARNLVIELNHGNASVPTIIFQDGSTLIEPSYKELMEKISSK